MRECDKCFRLDALYPVPSWTEDEGGRIKRQWVLWVCRECYAKWFPGKVEARLN